MGLRPDVLTQMATQSPPGSAFAAADPGFTAVPVEELLASVEELVARIRMCFGIDRDTFELDVQPLLRNYAAYVHLLPATADNYFSAPGGLLRLGLEVAVFSLHGTDAHIFPVAPRFRCAYNGNPAGARPPSSAGCAVSCTACSATSSSPTPLATSGRPTCTRCTPGSSITARIATSCAGGPTPRKHGHCESLALPHVVPLATLPFLNEDNSIIVPHLPASIGGMPM